MSESGLSQGSFPSSSADLSSFHRVTSRSLNFLLNSLAVEDLTNVHLYVKPQEKNSFNLLGASGLLSVICRELWT